MFNQASTKKRRFSWKALVLTALGLTVIQWFLYYFVINRDGVANELPRLPEISTNNSNGEAPPLGVPDSKTDLYPGNWRHGDSKTEVNNGKEEGDNDEKSSVVGEKESSSSTTGGGDFAIQTAAPEAPTSTPPPFRFSDASLLSDSKGKQEDIDENYLAFCISIKNQQLDLPEFLIHHYNHHGIRRFYIQDDGTVPPLSQNASNYGIPSSALTFTYYNTSSHVQFMQLKVYDDCMRQHGHKHKWMAFIDTDEFYETPGNETLQEVLKSFDGNATVGALAVNWRMHTSAGLLHRPESNRKAFTTCVWDENHPENKTLDTDNRHIKSIVKTDKYLAQGSPHNVRLVNGSITVGELGDEVTEWAMRRRISRERIVLHHYSLKSREQWAEKLDRGNGMGDPKSWEFWDRVEAEPHVECNEMASFDP